MAIASGRSLETVVVVLAVLKLGAAYVPLPAREQTARRLAMATDSQPRLVVVEAEADDLAAGLPLITVAALMDLAASGPADPVLVDVSATDPAWVLYTSGSTGAPKGVLGTHQGCLNRISWLYADQPIAMGEPCFQNTALTTVDSFWEILGPLGCGGHLHLLPDDLVGDVEHLIPKLAELGVRRICLVPSLLGTLLDLFPRLGDVAPQLTLWVASGEVLTHALVERFYRAVPAGILMNQYGMTESCADITYFDTRERRGCDGGGVPIGRAINGVELLLLDEAGQCVPAGEPAELYVAGACLAAGYLNRPEETAARFVRIRNVAGEWRRAYRSGDRVRLGCDGVLEFLGRADRQVKIRGYRVELDEVEAALSRMPGVRAAAVRMIEGIAPTPQLCAWIEGPIDDAAVRYFCVNNLPPHMRPTRHENLAAMPRTSTGKVDRTRLLLSHVAAKPSVSGSATSADPKVAQIQLLFAGVLGVQVPAADDDFFEIGGDSLAAIQLTAQLRAALGQPIKVSDIFRAPTPAGLSALFHEDGTTARPDLDHVIPRALERPLSFTQERLLAVQNRDGDVPILNVPYALRIDGTLDADAMRRALAMQLHHHDVFRTRAFFTAEGARQEFTDAPEACPLIQVDGADWLQPESFAGDLLYRPFQLDSEAPVRCALFTKAPDSFLLVLVFHQSVIDDWTLRILGKELSRIYEDLRQGREITAASATRYSDFAAWQRKLPESHFTAQREAWREMLDGAPDVVNLPTDRPHTPFAQYEGARREIRLPPELSDALHTLAEAERSTLYMVLLAAFYTLLYRLAGQEDIVVGAPVANRAASATRDIVGCFVNILPLRVRLKGETPFRTLLAQVKETVSDALSAQDLPFDRIVALQQVARDTGRQPLFQVMFAQRIAGGFPFTADDVECVAVDLPVRFTQYDLTFWIEEDLGGVRVKADFATALFDAGVIEGLLGSYAALLRAATLTPEQRIGVLTLYDEAARHRLLDEWQGIERPLPACSFVDQILSWCVSHPNSVAIEHAQGSSSYVDLDRHAGVIAARLTAAGVQRGDIVAILVSRGPELPAAMLAIAALGAAFLALDSDHPPQRLQFLVSDAGARAVLVIAETAGILGAADLIFVSAEAPVEAGQWGAPSLSAMPRPALCADACCYILYTSGSTGRPKGVEVLHGGLVNLLQDMRERLEVDETSRMVAITTVSFDISLLELLLPLTSNARVLLLSRDVASDPDALGAAIAEGGVTHVQATPSSWRMLFAGGWKPPRDLVAISGGEALPHDLAEMLRRHFSHVENVYGPTETTIWSTAWRLAPDERVSIGRPIANTRIYVVNALNGLAPIGGVGELLIAGRGVARGYLNHDELTRARFVEDPFRSGERAYRTGDLARFRPDGSLDFLGRGDTQCKVRGHRIELGEIEAVLRELPEVADAAVSVEGDQLVAHVVSSAPTGQAHLDLSLFFFAAEDAETGDRYRLFLESAQLADRLGLSAVWTPERHFHPVGGSYPNPSVLSAAIATLTERIGIRAGSVVLPLHSPFRVAEEWAVVDQLSGGRAGVAFASGWNPQDFAFFPERFERRREAMYETIDQVRRLWRGEKLPARDGSGAEILLEVFPRPVQQKLPVWITAAGPRGTFVAAGRAGANVLTHLLGQDLDELGEKIRAYRDARAEAGFDPGSGVVTVMLHAFIAETDEEAESVTEAPFKNYLRAHLSLDSSATRAWGGAQCEDLGEQIIESAYLRHMRNALIGSPERCLQVASRMRRIGADEVACLIDFGVPTASALASVAKLGALREAIAAVPVLDWDAIGRQLKHRLPAYMIPQRCAVVATLPKTANGKLDRKQLRPVGIVPEVRRGEAPETEWERRVCALWTEVLGVEIAEIHTSFFAAGGHSLSAARIMATIRQRHKVPVQLRDIFEYPTARRLAARLQELSLVGIEAETQLVCHAEDRREPSFAQERLLFLQEFATNEALYNTTLAYRIEGGVDRTALQQAFEDLIARHEVLHNCAHPEAGRFRLTRCEAATPFAHRTVSSAIEPETRRLVAAELETKFDLRRERPIRATLTEGPDSALFVLTVHHAVSDGWSVGLLTRDLSELYAARIELRAPTLPTLPYRYSDFAVWQRAKMREARLAEGLAFWSERLQNLPDRIDLPADRRRPAVPSYRGETVRRRLPWELADGLARLARDRDTTFFAALLACFTIVLHRHSNAEDIAIGTPVVTRPAGAENIVGLFLNTLVMRMRCQRETCFEDLLKAAGEALAAGDAHKDVPFERVVDALKVPRDTGRHSLFQIMLVLRNVDEPPLRLPGAEVTDISPEPGTAKFDLTLWAEQVPDGLELGFEFALDLFDRRRIETFARHFETLVASVLSDPLARVGTLAMLDSGQLREAYRQARGEILPLPPGETVHGLFVAQARRTPAAPAIVAMDGVRDYKWLDSRSDAVAAELQRCGVCVGDRVGIFLPREADLVAALLGVLKTGAAYVPLDPAYPAARVKAMADDAGLAVVLVSGSVADRLPPLADTRTINLDIMQQGHRPWDVVTPSDALSHIIYTSGSTGIPKGVEIEQANTVSMLRWALSRFSADVLARVLATTSICFDLSVFEIFTPLSVGGAVVIGDNFLALVDHPARDTITLCNTVPSVMDAYLGSASLPPSVRIVNLAGEPLTRALCDRVHAANPEVEIYNLYGPSECTTYSLEYRVPRGVASEPLIGRPIANTNAYILDAAGNIVPDGTVGELYLGGAGVARGYHNRAELTAQKFVADRFSAVPGRRLYATGDMVRRGAEGIEFLGRQDRQIKLNGYRIELGDIEAVLRNTGIVQNGVVLLTPVQGKPQLVAYVSPLHGASLDPARLRDLLRTALPSIMVPSHIVVLPSLPLTLNNKVDVRALPAPVIEAEPGIRSKQAASLTEEMLLRIWADLLGHENFGTSDNFFDAGGNSLMIMELRQRIVDQLGAPTTIVSLFQHPTIASFAATLGNTVSTRAGRDPEALDRIAQQRRALSRRTFSPRRGIHAE